MINIKFEIQSIFNKVVHESTTLTQNIDAANISYDDYHWFTSSLKDACNIVIIELYRLAKGIPDPIIINDEIIEVVVDLTSQKQEYLLPDAIERVIIDFIISKWFIQNQINMIVGFQESINNLKSVSLMSETVRRRSSF